LIGEADGSVVRRHALFIVVNAWIVVVAVVAVVADAYAFLCGALNIVCAVGLSGDTHHAQHCTHEW
jgi:hypothetical protein